MRAILRVGKVLIASALAAAPALALAQSTATPAPATNTTSPDAVGPSELQNFSLKGTVTRPADQTPAPTPARPQTAPVQPPTLPVSRPPARSTERTVARRPGPAPATVAPAANVTPAPVETAPAPVASPPVVTPAPVMPAPSLDATPVDNFAPFRGLPLWPWIAAALVLALGGGFLLWRRRTRELVADGPQFDLLPPAPLFPEPEPRPERLQRASVADGQPPSQPHLPQGIVTSRLRPAGPSGVVASRLRPSLEIVFHPLRCQVDDDQVAIEFELELFNAGTAPARAVLAEASLLNAGAAQDQELALFFANPHGAGERLDVIPPMKRASFRSQVVAPRAAVQEYELAGRKSFVPVIAFNALYEWSGGHAQSSAAYLVGRDTQQDKLGPLHLDQGAREYHGLGARPLPSGLRT